MLNGKSKHFPLLSHIEVTYSWIHIHGQVYMKLQLMGISSKSTRSKNEKHK